MEALGLHPLGSEAPHCPPRLRVPPDARVCPAHMSAILLLPIPSRNTDKYSADTRKNYAPAGVAPPVGTVFLLLCCFLLVPSLVTSACLHASATARFVSVSCPVCTVVAVPHTPLPQPAGGTTLLSIRYTPSEHQRILEAVED
eukprot:TRINITY_DN4805_c0_g3_i3.p2 TRINITY_DN4805_c0_g3~~TRINITY_DN4805_c0_g3_i3.p2  ORF type:complete len:143 (+),score=15.70 TRINITY_DN4805_c0_g3_i3:316-744(+)